MVPSCASYPSRPTLPPLPLLYVLCHYHSHSKRWSLFFSHLNLEKTLDCLEEKNAADAVLWDCRPLAHGAPLGALILGLLPLAVHCIWPILPHSSLCLFRSHLPQPNATSAGTPSLTVLTGPRPQLLVHMGPFSFLALAMNELTFVRWSSGLKCISPLRL